GCTPPGAAPAGQPPRASGTADAAASPAAVPIDLYLRRWQGIPPDVQIRVGQPRPSPLPGLEAVPVTLSRDGQTQQVQLLRSTDGRYLIPAPLLDLTVDPHEALARRIVVAGRASLGPATAPVTVVEYSSFQCPWCRRLAPVVKEVLKGPLGAQVRWVYKHLPLASQPWSEPAAVAAECARTLGGDQKFWALHDLYFDQQESFTPQNHRSRVVAWARGAGLPAEAFERCLDGPDARRQVAADADEARALGISSTPTLVINGRLAPGYVPAETLVRILEQELAYQQARERAAARGR
ncbi:MAG TPA: thioredoxin domain-containing protein, partial [Thermodesulfobacteriota bacterium]|nr:thioredoxin domain-containing protein [Thermodesulfobacteriota bacterium]